MSCSPSYDSYYYSRQRLTPLPVLRVKFADPGETWFYIDPATSQMLSQIPRLARVERWLYNGLHSLDFLDALIGTQRNGNGSHQML